jgi:hypothetical protein
MGGFRRVETSVDIFVTPSPYYWQAIVHAVGCFVDGHDIIRHLGLLF